MGRLTPFGSRTLRILGVTPISDNLSTACACMQCILCTLGPYARRDLTMHRSNELASYIDYTDYWANGLGLEL